jgi:hypothetical protein
VYYGQQEFLLPFSNGRIGRYGMNPGIKNYHRLYDTEAWFNAIGPDGCAHLKNGRANLEIEGNPVPDMVECVVNCSLDDSSLSLNFTGILDRSSVQFHRHTISHHLRTSPVDWDGYLVLELLRSLVEI